MSSVPTIKQNQQPAPYAPIHAPSKMFFSMPSAQEMQQLIDFCKVMATAPFYQKLGPGGVMAIYLTAKEHNLPFMACLNGGMHTFDGKVSFSAQLINAMIINAGHKADIIELTEQRCVIHFKRGDRRNDAEYKGLVYEYNIKQAEKAGYLKKTNWQTSPKDMLFSRCLTGGGRKHVPEVFVGVLVSGELIGDDSDSNIIPDIPLEATNHSPISNESVKPIEPVKIELQPSEGYAEFVEKHGLVKNNDGTMNRKMEFVTKSAEKTNMPEMKVINFAIKNEADFEKKFKKWEMENFPEKPTSMDELLIEE
ncbi:MAG: hypothetical protein C5B43_01305 [Verrucomicrobia bacterium]|nr:MAG: hypothetical protein C5B43_01305 [Verrucomicrobiota bacterium]